MGFFVSYIWALKKYKENDAPVFVVYNMGATHFQIPFLVLASKLSGAKIISVITDLDAANECDSLRDCFKYVWWRIQSNCVKCLDAVVVLNGNVISDLKYRKPNLHLKGIIPSDEFVGKVSKLKIISSKSNFRLLYMGSLNELRGITGDGDPYLDQFNEEEIMESDIHPSIDQFNDPIDIIRNDDVDIIVS